MASITTINSGDLITNSRSDINTNFANLNSDKIETSYIDTDTSLAANSDNKIATQKAVKTYIDTSGGANASETVRGIVEEATDAEVTAGTSIGGTGAKLFVTPAKLLTRDTTLLTPITTAKQFTVGALDNALVKTYFNRQIQFHATEWTKSSANVAVSQMGSIITFSGVGGDDINVNFFDSLFSFDTTKIAVLDFFAQLPASATGSIQMGFDSLNGSGFQDAYNNTNTNKIMFNLSSAGALYATIGKRSTGVTNTDISSGLTLTNWNHYRIEAQFGSGGNAAFYVNGVLKATLSGTNFPVEAGGTGIIYLGFGRSNIALFKVTAPNLAFKLI